MQIETSYVDVTVAGKVMRTFVAAPADDKRYPESCSTQTSFSCRNRRCAGSRTCQLRLRRRCSRDLLPHRTRGNRAGIRRRRQGSADRLTLTPSLPSSSTKTSSAGSPGCGTTRAFRLRRWGSPGTARAAHRISSGATARSCRNRLLVRDGLHDGKLGADADAGSLARSGEIGGELLMIFGSRDPHPADGLQIIHKQLQESGVDFDWHIYDAEHAFGRDIGPRWNPQATDEAMAQTVAFFRRTLGG